MPGKFTILCRGGRIGKAKAERENSVTSQVKNPLAGYKGGRIKRKLNWSKSTTLRKGEKNE